MAYLAASYFIQGAFKETMQALFVLAFAIGLAELAQANGAPEAPRLKRWGRLKAVPLAAARRSARSTPTAFPGLTWLVGTLGVFAVAEIVRARRLYADPRRAGPGARSPSRPSLVAAAPEIPRMIDFASFETFDPSGAGLGNLFNPISPIEALGIWPSGDFRLDPGRRLRAGVRLLPRRR